MTEIFNLAIYKPLFNALIFIYGNFSFGDLGVAIIFLTVLVRAVLFPLFHKSAKNQMIMTKLAPEIKKIQEAYKNDRERQTRELLALYKTHRINPFSSFFLLLIQLPILFALYRVFLNGIADGAVKNLYSFVEPPSELNFRFLGLIDLKEESIFIVALAALAQYWQGRLAAPKTGKGEKKGLSTAEMMGRQMVYLGPILTVAILSFLPAAVGVYWATTSVISALQQVWINKTLKRDESGDRKKNT